MLYNIEFAIQALERKISHAEGKRSIEDSEALQKTIAELQTQLDEQSKRQGMVAGQTKALHDELRVQRQQFSATQTQKQTLTDAVQRVESEISQFAKYCVAASKKRDDALVAADVLKLELTKLRKQLMQRADVITSLDKRRATLLLAWRERDGELRLHADVQRAQIKSASEQLHTLTVDVRERETKLDKLQKKYAIVTAKSASIMDSDNASIVTNVAHQVEHSQAYYIIAAAQQREELQRRGDALNEELIKCESDIAKLANAATVLQAGNVAYRQSLHAVDPATAGPQLRLKQELEDKVRHQLDQGAKQLAYVQQLRSDHRRTRVDRIVNVTGLE